MGRHACAWACEQNRTPCMAALPAHLVGIELDKNIRHALVILGIVLADSVDGIRHKFKHEMQICLILLLRCRRQKIIHGWVDCLVTKNELLGRTVCE